MTSITAATAPLSPAGPAPLLGLSLPLPALHTTVLDWYEAGKRDLPWRTPDASPWAVMVSEFMLQQTPVKRVLPAWEAWLERWPTPADLAAEPPGEAVRMWGRLGYPRRALRLHATAVAITEQHGGDVPDDHATLLSLPGVGEYTAAAVASFAFRQRHVVLDTNVRRVFARAVSGVEYPAQATTAAERRTATALLPDDAETAATWAVGVMELGALVCTARSPECGDCPLFTHCAWQRAGRPPYEGPARRGQSYEGTDRQVRGKLLAVLREAHGSVEQARLDVVWPDAVQRARALDGLVADGLVEPVEQGVYRLPQ
ncbi:A/G-specific adenine glycosylase [Kitasatospora aureofaciens]|uniref:A/G-specific adenine glycosylase n=1 Tax=Kitasatospora aureofaciens TaxID=1894 RepID=UPI001C44B83C|nr:A/G-specific adenine glycosylase [Kitasatospora aureofaciens]MBV6697123.1 A/G-specific adenine glycosylase [Kitasatospora aureofaciens]